MILLLTIVVAPLVALIAAYVLLITVTLVLAAITSCRKQAECLTSALYVGRVSHTRFFPVIHCFGYPLFMACIDLEENFQSALWPLSTVMALRSCDHYKNGEGDTTNEGGSLVQRTMKLVSERTNGTFVPTLLTHRVLLVTHLCYYGYCFNPVSFYYLQRRTTCTIDAVVAEVSNTPWNEMQCYVLQEKSIDIQNFQPGIPKGETTSRNYLFHKAFHVSPFMDMEHLYDWTFWEFDTPAKPIHISTSMIKGNKTYFNAHVELHPKGIQPFMLAWQLVRFPVYCILIQIWIHYEAFWLFVKGVAFVPHPKGSETFISWTIGTMMTPLFAFKDWTNKQIKRQ